MQARVNAFQQPIGPDVAGWTARPRPPLAPAEAATAGWSRCRRRATPPSCTRPSARRRTAATGPTCRSAFASEAEYRAFAERAEAGRTLHHAVIDLASGKAVGTLSLMRIDPANGVIEVGFVSFSPLLKRTRIATEAQFLLMRRVFDELGYRRYEWKCDSLNAPSRSAARLGFEFEGVFRQAVVYKGRSRGTAWFSIIDSEWPALRAAYERWLSPDNFDAEGGQRVGLAELIARERAACA